MGMQSINNKLGMGEIHNEIHKRSKRAVGYLLSDIMFKESI
jgi:hypothetical protein